MDARLQAEVWSRLMRGASLEDLRLPTVAGRVDLRGLAAPQPTAGPRYELAASRVAELSNLQSVRGHRWVGLHVANGILESLRFHDSTIEDCCFEAARCRDWRMWGTTIVDTTFRGADLRGAALGGVANGRRNAFRRVDFSRADLRRTAHRSADFVDCTFVDTRLDKVDFQGSVFVRCVFEGKLKEVLFYRLAFEGEALPPNEMRGVDLRRAILRFVEFRGLDMADVRWPEGDEHVLLTDYLASLDRVLAGLKGCANVGSKRLAAIVEMKRRWAGPNQRVGVINKRDLVEAGGEGAVRTFLGLVSGPTLQ